MKSHLFRSLYLIFDHIQLVGSINFCLYIINPRQTTPLTEFLTLMIHKIGEPFCTVHDSNGSITFQEFTKLNQLSNLQSTVLLSGQNLRVIFFKVGSIFTSLKMMKNFSEIKNRRCGTFWSKAYNKLYFQFSDRSHAISLRYEPAKMEFYTNLPFFLSLHWNMNLSLENAPYLTLQVKCDKN